MDVTLLLLILRLAAGVLLLLVMGIIGWLLYREMRVTASWLVEQQSVTGELCLLDAAGEVAERYRLRPVTSLGRLPSNTIVLTGGYVSAEHALITRRGQQWWLEDLHSRNGTRLNELSVVEPMVVAAGDIISIGDQKLRVDI